MATTYVPGTSGFDSSTPLYNLLVNKVYDWSNRDISALPTQIVRDTLRYAADKSYRTLRIPPLEQVFNYTTLTADTSLGSTFPVFRFPIPGDLIEFIQIRQTDEANNGLSLVFNEKADIRTFRDAYSEKYNDYAYWTRERGNVLLSGFEITEATNIELYYYRRLPALNAQYSLTLANLNLGNLQTSADVTIPVRDPVYTAAELATFVADGAVGREVPQWLRDENERIVLFGALTECFAYLQEDDQAQKYGTLFYEEIKELNDEERMLRASGGNVQMNFNGRGLI